MERFFWLKNLSKMKKYLLKLIELDLESTAKRLIHWNKMEDRFKSDLYHIRCKIALERKLERISKYKTRLQKLF